MDSHEFTAVLTDAPDTTLLGIYYIGNVAFARKPGKEKAFTPRQTHIFVHSLRSWEGRSLLVLIYLTLGSGWMVEGGEWEQQRETEEYRLEPPK
jgi:hypothetical protein